MTAVVLLAHGSPDPRSATGTCALAEDVATLLPRAAVEVAFLDHDDRTLPRVVRALSDAGHREAVVVPLFLSTAHHVRVDVPEAVAQARAAGRLDVQTTLPLGPDPDLIPLLGAGLPARGQIVLAAAGTRDAAAQASIAELAARWSQERGEEVSVAYATMAAPALPEHLDALIDRGVRPHVAPYVLFDGVLPERITHAAQERGLVAGAPLGAHAAPLVLARIRQVLDSPPGTTAPTPAGSSGL